MKSKLIYSILVLSISVLFTVFTITETAYPIKRKAGQKTWTRKVTKRFNSPGLLDRINPTKLSDHFNSTRLLDRFNSTSLIDRFNLSKLADDLNITNYGDPYERLVEQTRRSGNKTKSWLFKDYLMKFHPHVVLNRVTKKKKQMGLNTSLEEDFNAIYEGIDLTDDLLRFNVETVSGRRKWRPSGHPLHSEGRGKDIFSLRMRLFELIRHTVYQTRNRMVIMQILRTKYRNSSLYKMGFLMSRTDFACKDFHAFAYRSIHPCPNRYLQNAQRYEVISMLHADERLLNKWFEIELLIDLINANHKHAEEVLETETKGRKKKWEFDD